MARGTFAPVTGRDQVHVKRGPGVTLFRVSPPFWFALATVPPLHSARFLRSPEIPAD